MKQIRLNTLIVIDYENEKLDKLDDIVFTNGINDILQEELKFELDDVDPKAKITVETVIQKKAEEV